MTKMHLMTLDITEVEARLGLKLKRNCISLGLDTATKTGYSIAETNKKELRINVGFINVDVSKIKDRDLRDQLRYDTVYKSLIDLIKPHHRVVIENVYYGGNARTLIILSRIGAIAWTICKFLKVKKENIIWKSAAQARKMIGIKGNAKKAIVMAKVNEFLGINLRNDDEADAVVLSLVGLIEGV